VFEGLLTSVMIRMEDAGAIKRGMFHYFMGIAKTRRSHLDGWQVGFDDRPLVVCPGHDVRLWPPAQHLGMSRVRVAYTAGEAIGPDLFSASSAPSAST
jgi:long-chain acyl-CoA synthetase